MRLQNYTLACMFTVELPEPGVEMESGPIEDRASRMVERIGEDIDVQESSVLMLMGPAVAHAQSCTVVATLLLDVSSEPVANLVEGGALQQFMQESIEYMCRRVEDDAQVISATSDVVLGPPIRA